MTANQHDSVSNETRNTRRGELETSQKKKRKGREEVNGAGLLLAGGSGLAASGEQVVGVPNERNGFNLNDLTCLMNEETMQKKRAGGVFVCASVSLPSVLL